MAGALDCPAGARLGLWLGAWVGLAARTSDCVVIAPAAQVGGLGCGCVGSTKILVRALIWAVRLKAQFNAGLFKSLIQFKV